MIGRNSSSNFTTYTLTVVQMFNNCYVSAGAHTRIKAAMKCILQSTPVPVTAKDS